MRFKFFPKDNNQKLSDFCKGVSFPTLPYKINVEAGWYTKEELKSKRKSTKRIWEPSEHIYKSKTNKIPLLWLRVSVIVKDVDDRRKNIELRNRYDIYKLNKNNEISELLLCHLIRREVQDALLHEVSEAFTLNRNRIYDPHLIDTGNRMDRATKTTDKILGRTKFL